MVTKGKEWLHNHFSAILSTLVVLQNWHFFGGKFDSILRGLADLLSAVGGS